MDECSGAAVVARGVPLLLDGHKVGPVWFKEDPLSSSVRLNRSIEAIVVTIGSRTSVAFGPIVVRCGEVCVVMRGCLKLGVFRLYEGKCQGFWW